MGIIRMVRLTGSWVTSRLNVRSDRGATAVEYGLMVALIAAVIIAAVVVLGSNTSSTFDCTATSIASKTASCS